MTPDQSATITRLRDIYDSPNGNTGCCLHIVTDDGNIEDSFVQFSLDRACESNHPNCVKAAEQILAMCECDRLALYLRYREYA